MSNQPPVRPPSMLRKTTELPRPPLRVRSKSLFKSKVFWLNAASFGAAVAPALGAPIEQMSPEVTALVAVANVLLRIITSQGVHLVREKE